MATRGDYQIGANLTGVGTDDPDANFFENYACGSPRNYSQYCSEEVMKMLDRQSQELDPKKRLEHYAKAEEIMQTDVGYVPVAWVVRYFVAKPHVRGIEKNKQGEFVVDGNIYVDMLSHIYLVDKA